MTIRSSPYAENRFDSPAASQMYDYYRSRAAPEIGAAVDIGFWRGLIMQLASIEPAVKHAVTAIGALHADMTMAVSREHQQDCRELGLSEYNKAMSAVRMWPPGGDAAARSLLVCLLFVCIEFILGYNSAAQMHIAQGRRILAGLPDKQSPMMDVVKNELVPVWRRLSIAGSLFAGKPEAIPKHLVKFHDVPPYFTTMADARDSLFVLIDEALRFINIVPLHFPLEPSQIPGQTEDISGEERNVVEELFRTRDHLLSQADAWRRAFDMFEATSSTSPVIAYALNVLLTHLQALRLWVLLAMDSDKMASDRHLSAFTAILNAARKALEARSLFSPERPSFTFETELVAPLYYTVLRCSHRETQQEALRLLNGRALTNRSENLWTTANAVTVAKKVLEIEDIGRWSQPTILMPNNSTNNDSVFDPSEASNPVYHPTTELTRRWAIDPELGGDYDWRHSSPESDHSFTAQLAVGEPTVPYSEDWNSRSGVGSSPYSVSQNVSEAMLGVPLAHRALNVVIEDHTSTGVWVTVYREADAYTGKRLTLREHVTVLPVS